MTDIGPPVANLYVYGVVDALDDVARETGKTVPQIAPTGCSGGRAWRASSWARATSSELRHNLGAVGWNLTAEQVTKLDAASTTAPAYPYWHQRGFAERNPPPVG